MTSKHYSLNTSVPKRTAAPFPSNSAVFIAGGSVVALVAKRKQPRMNLRDISLLTGSIAGPSSILRENSLAFWRLAQSQVKISMLSACRCLVPGCLGVVLGNQVATNFILDTDDE
uniref:Uncharacterized protein n=1 Tax=Pseudictyota dubia TaxID=2749911 RepID=A0A7R9ZFJ2_9STRA|mmetsp:Transcript_49043/g.90866  ORF Transcript_49043/g.90866 Transcript_49043/m.90866 type:complete len:115 (+) Transcript_49043:363-707(+)